jgi:phosphatidylserine decarboxylase
VGTLVLGGLCAAAVAWSPWAAIAPAALWGVLVNFFRDPERVPPEGEEKVVSPADGRVADIAAVREDEFLHAEALRIGIFMSVFDVHVNRAPLAGRVVYRGYREGKFRNAMGAEATRENECALVGMERPDGSRILVRQIAGLVARRIVTDCAVGDHLHRGQRFGMVKFGSRLEVYLPASLSFRPAVAVGERVRAGASVLGRIADRGLPIADCEAKGEGR